MSKRAKLVIIDGKAIFHRAYHAIPHLSNKDGVPTNAVYGFAAMTLKALADLKPDYVVLAWDKAKTSLTQRTKLYPDYKIKRLKMPDDFYAQIPFIAELATALHIPMIELDHYEADDIIGTLVQRHPELEILIATNDRDMFQMINDHTRIYMQRRGMTETEIYDAAKVMERYGIVPKQIIDLKALEGDASDNIPGVAGVGEKTALELIKKYGSLDSIYQHLDEIPGKLQDKLRDNREVAYLSHKLATIMCDAPVELTLEDARWGRHDRQAIHELFRRLNFKSLLRNLPPELDYNAGGPPSLFDAEVPQKSRAHIKSASYHCVLSVADLEKLTSALERVDRFAFDVETNALDVMAAQLVGLAVSFQEGEAYYIPVGHASGEQLDTAAVIEALKPVLENPSIGKVGHNLKFDYQIMRRYGVDVAPVTFDTMIAAFILNPLGRAQTLSDLAFSELGLEMIEITELLGRKGKDQISFDAVAVEDATRYAAEDADVSWRLYQKLKPELEKAGFNKLAEATEWPLIPVLANMELAGIQLDVDFLKDFNKRISAKILELEEAIWKASGEHFNISSPAQLGKILYGKLGLSAAGVKRGKTGASSTAAGELEKLRGQHPVVEHLFEYRELVKLKNTYVDALPKQIGPDGRVHTSFSQTIAQTGRLSSTNPNLQNIPIRTEVGREIRKLPDRAEGGGGFGRRPKYDKGFQRRDRRPPANGS
jgi:DNA polymerase I